MEPAVSSLQQKRKGTTFSLTAKVLVLLALGIIGLFPKLHPIGAQRNALFTTGSLNSSVDAPSGLGIHTTDLRLKDDHYYFDAKRKEQLDHSEIVVVPFDPYNTCHSKVPQATCFRTLSLSHTQQESPIPVAFDLVAEVCKDVPEGGDHVDFLLCLQYGDFTGILAMRDNDTAKGFQYLFPVDAAYYISPSSSSRAGVHDVNVIDRKIAAMYGYYRPKSEQGDKARGDDNNAGNAIWQYGATHMLNPITTLIEGHTTKHADAVVIAAANVLNMEREGMVDFELRNYLDIVRRHRAPTAIVGMGMQASFQSKNVDVVANMTLFSFQKQVLGEIEMWQSAPAIGVRGNITANLCRNSGIAHCVPMGCPSLTISHDLNLGKTLQANWNTVLERLDNGEKLTIGLVLPAIEPQELGPRAEQRDLLLNSLGQNCLIHNCVFLLQQPFDEFNAYRLNDLVLQQNQTELKLKKFNNVEDWLGFVRDRVDVVISTRIHGAMACISSGTPTVVIPTDYRIMELVDAMHVPHVPAEVVQNQKLTDVASFLKNARFSNFEEFEKNRRDKIAQWRKILHSVGLEMNRALLDILDPSNR